MGVKIVWWLLITSVQCIFRKQLSGKKIQPLFKVQTILLLESFFLTQAISMQRLKMYSEVYESV